MITDKAKLKALADAATPGRAHDRLDSCGGGLKYTCNGDDGSLVLRVDHKNDEFGFIGPNHSADEAFFLACTPATVLAILAEIEQLNANRGEPIAYMRNEGTPNNLVKCTFTDEGAFGVFR